MKLIDDVKAKVASLSHMKVGHKLESQVYLDKDQLRILEFIEQMGKISAQDVVDILEVPKRTAQLYLQRLKKMKMIAQAGKGPAAAYVLEK